MEPNLKHKKYLNFDIVDVDTAIKKSNLIIILVNHKKFKNKKIINRLKNKETLDISGLLINR